jgi:hypothetical protein
MNTVELKKKWAKDAKKHLKGRRIVNVRWMTQGEVDDLGWYAAAPVLELDNGIALYCSQDDEGNGAGALFTTIEDFSTLPVI